MKANQKDVVEPKVVRESSHSTCLFQPGMLFEPHVYTKSAIQTHPWARSLHAYKPFLLRKRRRMSFMSGSWRRSGSTRSAWAPAPPAPLSRRAGSPGGVLAEGHPAQRRARGRVGGRIGFKDSMKQLDPTPGRGTRRRCLKRMAVQRCLNKGLAQPCSLMHRGRDGLDRANGEILNHQVAWVIELLCISTQQIAASNPVCF